MYQQNDIVTWTGMEHTPYGERCARRPATVFVEGELNLSSRFLGGTKVPPSFLLLIIFLKQIQLGSGECTVGYAVKWNVPFLVGRNLR